MLKGHNGAVRCVDFSNHRTGEDSFLVTCSDDKTLKLWNLPHKTFRCSMVGHKNWVRTCKFSPDSKYVMSGSDDGTLKLWDVSNGDNVVTYRFPSSIITFSSSAAFESTVSVRHIHFHPTGNILAASGSDGNVHMYDLRSDKVVHSIPEINNNQSMNQVPDVSTSLSFHPDGNHLMTCNNGGLFSLWDVRNWKNDFIVTHGQSDCKDGKKQSYCCNFSPNGCNFVTGGSDKKVIVWKGYSEKNTSNPSKTSPLPKKQTSQQIHARHGTKKIKSKRDSIDKKCTSQNKAITLEREYVNDNMTTKNTNNNPCDQKQSDSNLTTREPFTNNDMKLPEPLTGVIDHIIGQLDLITSKIVTIEKRLGIQEEAMATFKKETMNSPN